MRLSVLSLLRRGPPRKSKRRAVAAAAAVPAAPSPRRLTSLPPAALLTHLAHLSAPLPPLLARDLSVQIATPSFLAPLITHALAHPEHAALAFTLLTYTASARRAIAHDRALLALVVEPFGRAHLAAPLASHLAALLARLLADFPQQLATFLYASPFAVHLVRHVALQPVAHLLPRLVGTRLFSPLRPAPVRPAHKRARALLLSARVQDRLADAFVAAAATFPSAAPPARPALVAVLDNATAAMAELSARALCVPRKYEDPDERTDRVYAAPLGLVSAAVCNDAKDHLTLLATPAPLTAVLRAGLVDHAACADIMLPALQLAARVLRAAREGCASPLPRLRDSAAAVDLGDVGDALACFAARFAAVLAEEGAALGRRRLAVLDVVREMCDTLPERCVARVLTADDDAVWRRVLAVAERYARNDVLQVRVAQIVAAVFTRCGALSGALLQRTHIVAMLAERPPSARLEAAVDAVLACAEARESGDKGQWGEDKEWRRLREAWERWKREMQGVVMPDASKGKGLGEAEAELEAGDDSMITEDYGQELYLYGLLDEASSKDHRTPPVENVVHMGA